MTTIAANDANIVYSPYTWHVNGTRAKTISPGAYFRVLFSGDPNTLTATFDVTNQPSGKTRISVRVDGGPWQDVQIAASVPLTMPANTWGSHTVEFMMRSHSSGVDRWASPQPTAVLFTGLTADVTVTTRTNRLRPLRGFAIGDSMGEGIAAWANTAGGFEDNHDARYGWAYPLGALLGAEVGMACFGGMAYSDASSTSGVPKAPDSAPYLWAGQARDLATSPPDFIVVNLGVNDSLHGNSDAAVTADSTALLNWLLTQAPAAKVFLVPGWSANKAAAIQAGIAASVAPNRVTYVNTAGWWNSADSSDNLHPYGYINTHDLAPRLANVIRPALSTAGTGYFIRDAAGNAVPIG